MDWGKNVYAGSKWGMVGQMGHGRFCVNRRRAEAQDRLTEGWISKLNPSGLTGFSFDIYLACTEIRLGSASHPGMDNGWSFLVPWAGANLLAFSSASRVTRAAASCSDSGGKQGAVFFSRASAGTHCIILSQAIYFFRWTHRTSLAIFHFPTGGFYAERATSPAVPLIIRLTRGLVGF